MLRTSGGGALCRGAFDGAPVGKDPVLCVGAVALPLDDVPPGPLTADVPVPACGRLVSSFGLNWR
ncbi:hypothetical protein ABZX12_19855 [Kribbella sp. NPDC003505]|uniref:hypothetical protein n=1 Tax=Kribbella sp. NPDC003505 TaxID=3154448 RepID=UPI0033B639C7